MNKFNIFRVALVAVLAAIGLTLSGCGEHAEPLDFELPGNSGPR